MTKKQQIIELKRMVNRTINGFEGTDETTEKVNMHLSRAYVELCSWLES